MKTKLPLFTSDQTKADIVDTIKSYREDFDILGDIRLGDKKYDLMREANEAIKAYNDSLNTTDADDDVSYTVASDATWNPGTAKASNKRSGAFWFVALLIVAVFLLLVL